MGKKNRNREILNILHSNNQEQIVNFVKEKELIQTTPPLCANKNCKGFGTKQMSFSPRKSHKDQYNWRCMTCLTYKSIRTNSFFEDFKLTIAQVLLLIYNWCKQTPHDTVAEEVVCDRAVVGTCYKRLRKKCAKINQNSKITLGGEGRQVEIDESLFVRVKHHKGKDLRRQQVWVFGLYERPLEEQKILKKKGRCLFSTNSRAS